MLLLHLVPKGYVSTHCLAILNAHFYSSFLTVVMQVRMRLLGILKCMYSKSILYIYMRHHLTFDLATRYLWMA